jgi:hypothetical protein
MRLGWERRGKRHTRENGAQCETAHEKPVIERMSVALPTLETNLPTKMPLVSSICSTFKKKEKEKKGQEAQKKPM